MNNLTLLLPVKNGSKFLVGSLENLSKIAGPKDEILVINDSSTDNSLDIIHEFQQLDPRIRVVNANQHGLVNALNLGLKESTNNWIARCDVDDIYDVNRIDLQRQAIGQDVSGIFTDYNFFTEGVDSLGHIPSAIKSQAVSVSLSKSQRTAHPSIVYLKEAVLSAGGYREEDFPAEDLSLWLRMSKDGKLISIPKVLLNYRLTPLSISMQKRTLIQQKTKNLLSKIGINSQDFLYTLENLDSIFQFYDNYDQSNRRKLLLLRELLEIQHNPAAFGISKNQKVNILRNLRFFINTEFIFEGISLKCERNSRNKLRQMVKNDK